MKKNDNKKKSQVIQHLHRISEVNHVHMITSIFLLWGYLLKTMYMKKNDNKKKSQVIQHLHGISEVNHVHMIYHF